MTNARYVPRHFCRRDHEFGRELEIEWTTTTVRGVEGRLLTAKIRAAEQQHRIAFEVRRGADEWRVTLPEVARVSGMTVDRLHHLLRGDIVMRLEDIAVLDLTLGGIVDHRLSPLNNARLPEEALRAALADITNRPGRRDPPPALRS